MAAMLSCQLSTEIVLMALGLCAACCFSVILFSMQTKVNKMNNSLVLYLANLVYFLLKKLFQIDFTRHIAVISVIGFAVLWFGIFAIIFSWIIGHIQVRAFVVK